jgi:hypothetical protein
MEVRKMQMIKASRKKRFWFWLTCWRPCTKYEYTKLWEFLLKFGNAVEKDHMRFQKDIMTLKAQVEIKNIIKKRENIERGMYE